MKDTKQYRFTGKEDFDISKFKTNDHGEFGSREEAVDEFVENLRKINKLQQKLYAERKEGVIFVFQAMDAAGKDGVIRTVFSTLTPHGVKEYCFKVPSQEEASHDYLWRFWSALPARGNISIFNRSYYEDVLVGKVHKLYENQIVPDRMKNVDIIKQRYDQINDFENYLYSTGTRVVKIFLNVSKDEQAKRFISRLDTPKKNWKVSSGDMKEREYWDDYMDAFEKMVNKTSTENSPWYVVPADHKWYARLIVSRIVLQTLIDVDPKFPVTPQDELDEAMAIRQSLVDSLGGYEGDKNDGEDSYFNKTGDVAADILYDEEQEKIKEKAEELKDNGFKAVREMLAAGYILKSPKEIVEAVATCGDLDDILKAEEEPAEEVLPEYEIGFGPEISEEEHCKDIERAYSLFNIGKTVKLSDDDADLLLLVSVLNEDGDESDFYTVCDMLDKRPSKLDKHIGKLIGKDALSINEEGNLIATDTGLRSLYYDKKLRKSDKRFRKFIDSLSAEELKSFLEMCDDLKIEDEDQMMEEAALEQSHLEEFENAECCDTECAEEAALEEEPSEEAEPECCDAECAEEAALEEEPSEETEPECCEETAEEECCEECCEKTEEQ